MLRRGVRLRLTPLTAPLRRAVTRVEVAQIERVGTSALGLLARTPVLVLTTTGRVSGRRRGTPLARAPRPGGGWLVVGGAAGQRRLPDWVANVRADGAATVVVGRRRVDVRADELTGAARAEAWDRLRRRWPRIERYERRAGRPVPVVALVPDERHRRPEARPVEPGEGRPRRPRSGGAPAAACGPADGAGLS